MTCAIRIYRKIPLIRSRRTEDKFDEPIFRGLIYEGRAGGGGGGLIFGRKNNSICNFLKLLFFLFSSIKHVLRHFPRRARREICPKLTIKTPEYVKLTIKFEVKTLLTSFSPL